MRGWKRSSTWLRLNPEGLFGKGVSEEKNKVFLSNVLSHLPFPQAARGKLSIYAMAAIGAPKK